MNINHTPITVLDKHFTEFAHNTISRKKPDKVYVISQLQHYQTQYNNNGFFRDYIVRLESLALNMENVGLLDLAGIVFSKLAKFPTTDEMKEKFLYGGLRVARRQHDYIHVLARIVDLKKLYESTNKPQERFKMLFMEEKALTDIVNNFGRAQKKYKTVSKAPSSESKYKLQLARTKVDISKNLPKHEAYSRLLEAKKIFEELGCIKEVKFVERLLF